MTHAHQILYDEIVKLPPEKVGKMISFVRYLEQETDFDLFLDTSEENELYALLDSDDFVDSSSVLANIMELHTKKYSHITY